MTRPDDRVTAYALDVVEGRTEHACGKLHIAACRRHLDDLDTDGFPYVYDPAQAARIIDFAETLTLSEGTDNSRLRLLGCQAFDLGCQFGWVHRDDPKLRRFRRSYICKARQQGKTLENGIKGAYLLAFSGYRNGSLFTAATKRRQAKLAWNEVKKFIEADPDLSEWFRVVEYNSLITCPSTGCTLEALSREGGLDDGFRSIYVSLDEIHQHKDNKIYKALLNGQRSVRGITPLLSMITTRGKVPAGFAKEEDDYAVKILMRDAYAEDYFIDVYALDDGDDIWDEANWAKSNPYTVTQPLLMDTMRSEAAAARDKGGEELADFKVKSLNMWLTCGTDNVYVDPDAWRACASDLTIDDMDGRRCYVGVDLSSGGDLTTVALLFELDSGEFFVHSHSWMPRGRQAEHVAYDSAPYDVWEERELITVTGTENDFKNDYTSVSLWLRETIEAHRLEPVAIGYDRHNADYFLRDLEDIAPCIEVPQLARDLDGPTEDVRLLVKEHKYHYNRYEELLSWSFSNARLVSNSSNEVKVDKRAGDRHRRIDPVDAAIDAHYVYRKLREESAYDVNELADSWLEMWT